MELVPEPLRVCLVFIFDAHDGAGALWYYRGVCHDSRAPTYFLSIKKQFLSQFSQFSRLQTLICLFYKSARRPNPVFLMWSVKGKEAESKQGSYSESTMTVCLEFRVAGCALVLMHPGLRGQWIFFFWFVSIWNGGQSILHECLLNCLCLTCVIARMCSAVFLCTCICVCAVPLSLFLIL